MSRRARALLFAAIAALCAIGSAALASGYRESATEELGETTRVLLVTEAIPAGVKLERKRLRSSVEIRTIPARFAAADAIAVLDEAVGRRAAAPVPPGSYLLASQLRAPRSRPPGPKLPGGLRPVEIAVAGSGALAGHGSEGGRVDVVVAGEPTAGGPGRVRIAARGVRLLALTALSPEEAATAATGTVAPDATATLALSRRQALELIEASNYAREVRLIGR